MKKRLLLAIGAIILFFVAVALVKSMLHSALGLQEPQKSAMQNYSEQVQEYEKIVLAGESLKNGFADPSLEYGPDGTGWMSYSVVEFPLGVKIHLAKTVDHGKTWEFVREINNYLHDTVNGIQGKWNHETSSIVYDPDDPGREWKIFYFTYFRTNAAMLNKEPHTWTKSWIAYKHASNPDGQWSEEINLLSSGEYKDKGLDLSGLHADLSEIVFFNEIGTIYSNGVLFMSLDASATKTGLGKFEKRKIILLYSKDHGKTWGYAGTLTDYADSRNHGYLTFTASSMVEESGRLFLFVSPSGRISDPKDPEGHHDGIHIFEFEDITKARLKRDYDGKLVLVRHIEDNLEKGGQGDYDEGNSYGGIVLPQQDLKYFPEVFQLFSTREKITK